MVIAASWAWACEAKVRPTRTTRANQALWLRRVAFITLPVCVTRCQSADADSVRVARRRELPVGGPRDVLLLL